MTLFSLFKLKLGYLPLLLAISCMMALGNSHFSVCLKPSKSNLTNLAVGQKVNIKVRSRDCNHSGIELEAGGLYSFSVDTTDYWIDLVKKTNADGFPSPSVLKSKEHNLPFPKENWFKLLGAVETDTFVIGTKHSNYSPPFTGELICFVNDFRFWNNWGRITLNIKREK